MDRKGQKTMEVPYTEKQRAITKGTIMPNGVVIILRGPSGCGKTTYTKEHYPGATIVSADHYFEQTNPTDGKVYYRFDPTKLSQAHNQCFGNFLTALNRGDEVVVVDNTHIHHWEYENYVKGADLCGYNTEFVEFHVMTTDALKECIKRNTHGVPAEVISRMVLEFEPHQDSRVIEVL